MFRFQKHQMKLAWLQCFAKTQKRKKIAGLFAHGIWTHWKEAARSSPRPSALIAAMMRLNSPKGFISVLLRGRERNCQADHVRHDPGVVSHTLWFIKTSAARSCTLCDESWKMLGTATEDFSYFAVISCGRNCSDYTGTQERVSCFSLNPILIPFLPLDFP